MAQRVTTQLVDDLDGGGADETVLFGLDGVSYEIDLRDENAARLREALAEYVQAARRTGGRKQYRAGGTAPAVIDREQNQAMRDWARNEGMQVSDRGRISKDIAEAYQAAGGRPTKGAKPKPGNKNTGTDASASRASRSAGTKASAAGGGKATGTDASASGGTTRTATATRAKSASTRRKPAAPARTSFSSASTTTPRNRATKR